MVYDANLTLRSTADGSLTQTETDTLTAVGPTPAGGYALVVNVPLEPIGDTLDIALSGSTDGTTWEAIAQDINIASVTQSHSNSRQFVRRFSTPLPQVRAVFTVAGTTPDYGVATAFIVPSAQWNRPQLGNTITDDDEATVTH